MYGRYELSVDSRNGDSIFTGYFNSINRLTKTLCCFDQDYLSFTIYDVILDRDIDPYALIEVFKNEMIIL